MKLLLDTHAAIWLSQGRAAESLCALYEDPANEIHLSTVSLWEMAIKRSIGKLDLAGDLAVFRTRLEAEGVRVVPLGADHSLRVERLPWVHRDPFDRVLAATCLVEGWTIASVDAVFDGYGVPRRF